MRKAEDAPDALHATGSVIHTIQKIKPARAGSTQESLKKGI